MYVFLIKVQALSHQGLGVFKGKECWAANFRIFSAGCGRSLPGGGHPSPGLIPGQADFSIAGDVAATEIGFNFTAFNGWKL